MTFTAWDAERSSPSPPDGAVAPPSCDAAAEPAAASEAHEAGSHPETATEKSSRTDTAHAKAPAASLVSIGIKHKPVGPAKAGDLTRFFEIAHRQAPPSPRSEAPPEEETPAIPVLEPETAPAAEAEAPPPAEMPVETDEPEPALLETNAEPAASPEIAIEPSFPLMLAAPPAAAADVADPTPAEPDPAPIADGLTVAEPTWFEAATAQQPVLSSESIEPLNVSFAPTEDEPTPAEAPEPPRVEPEPAPAATATAELVPLVVPPPALESAPPPVAVAPAEPGPVEPVPVAPPAPTFKDLADYWRAIRNGADHPAAEVIDRDLITERWPGTLLIAYTPASHDPRGELRPGRVTRLGTACAETQNVVDAGSHSTEWMLEVAHTALVNDEPVEEQQRLSTLTGVAGFRMVALPLGAPKGLANAVLCTLLPCPSAPRFGKRRIWL